MKTKCNFIILLFFVTSCGFKSAHESQNLKKIDLSDQSVKLSFPKILWDKIKDQYRDNFEFKNNVYDFFKTLPISVSLTSEKKGVLKDQNTLVQMAGFGGDFELSEFVGDNVRGFFNLKLNFDIDKDQVKKIKVFYLSASKKRRIFGETVGNGCDLFMDLTDYFQSNVFSKGLKLHSGQARHVSTLAGKYYFVLQEANSVNISQLTIKDSKKAEFECEGGL